MASNLPIRSAAHVLEESSRRFIEGALPHDWTCEKTSPDYGADLRVDIYESGKATGLELLVQLKSSARRSRHKTNETVRIKTSTYNYLWSKVQVAVLVKFVESDNEAYWMWLRDVVPPSDDRKRFTVHIPRSGRVSNVDWGMIATRVRRVTDVKLAAMRRAALQSKARALRRQVGASRVDVG